MHTGKLNLCIKKNLMRVLCLLFLGVTCLFAAAEAGELPLLKHDTDKNVLYEYTAIPCRPLTAFNTNTAKSGDIVRFAIIKDVHAEDGRIMLRQGTVFDIWVKKSLPSRWIMTMGGPSREPSKIIFAETVIPSELAGIVVKIGEQEVRRDKPLYFHACSLLAKVTDWWVTYPPQFLKWPHLAVNEKKVIVFQVGEDVLLPPRDEIDIAVESPYWREILRREQPRH